MDPELKRAEAALVHDLNNYLQVVMGNLELLKRKGSAAPEIVEAALAATRTAAQLADRLGSFRRLQSYEPRPLDLNRVVRDLTAAVATAAGDAVRVEPVLAPNLPMANADPRHVHSALVELASAARGCSGRFQVRTSAADGHVVLEVEGLPQERLTSLAAPGELLYIVERCVRQSGGRMETANGFRLYLPAK
jgi:signal transduction histidine kinase